MKLFHEEYGKEVAYVQIQDIMYLTYQTIIPKSSSVFSKVFTNFSIIDNSNRFNFIRLTDEDEIKFFKEADFIINYDDYKFLTDEQIKKHIEELQNKVQQTVKKYNHMILEYREENNFLFYQYRNFKYIIKILFEILDIRHGTRSMPFPDFV